VRYQRSHLLKGNTLASTDQTERAGVLAVGHMFTKLGWAFREQPTSDFGIDAHVEKLGADGKGIGKLVALQIKSGKSYFKERGDGFVFYGEERHREYWANHSLPVFIILHDPETGLTLWQKVEERLIEDKSNGRWAIPIPADQLLDQQHEAYFERGIAADLGSVRRYRLVLDLPLIERFSQEEAIFLRVEDWVNKGLNFRRTEVVFDENPEAELDMELPTWLPAYTVNRFMGVLFPWLDWTEHEYVDASEYANEVAYHILEVEVNSIGRAALCLEEFYNSDPPSDETPEFELDDALLNYLAEQQDGDDRS
tara:strand:- start:471 stop:1400 length:930 start_codon:yes stop_codon:yes gene_type:complete